MSNRRMISKSVVESARFLTMPISSQCLYFHLIVNADDDGVVEAYPVILLCKANPDDLKVLVEKEFVCVLNEEMVTYIVHWREMNILRADRKTDSRYMELLQEKLPNVSLLPKKQRSDLKKKEINGPTLDGPRTAQPNLTQSNLKQHNIKKQNKNQSNQNQLTEVMMDSSSPVTNEEGNTIGNSGYEDIISENIELDSLRASAKIRGPDSQTLVEAVYKTICDVVNNPTDQIVIKNQNFSWRVVQSQFLKLRRIHVTNVISRVDDGKYQIKNLKSYLLSALYTESISNQSYTPTKRTPSHNSYSEEDYFLAM